MHRGWLPRALVRRPLAVALPEQRLHARSLRCVRTSGCVRQNLEVLQPQVLQHERHLPQRDGVSRLHKPACGFHGAVSRAPTATAARTTPAAATTATAAATATARQRQRPVHCGWQPLVCALFTVALQ